MRWDQITDLEPGDILIDRAGKKVVEVYNVFMGSANCIVYNEGKTISIDRKDLRKWKLYRAFSYRRKKERHA